MLNLLMIADDTSAALNRNYYYLEEELKKLTNLMIWRESGRLGKIISKLPVNPDFILIINDIGKGISPVIKDFHTVNIPTGLIVNDVHRFTELRRNFIKRNGNLYIFSVVRDKFYEIYPEYKHRMKLFPNFVNTNLYKDYRLNRNIDLLMMGAVNEVYPLRKAILTAYENDPNFIYHEHPGYRNFKKSEENELPLGEKYVMEINRAKLFFTCPSIYYYPVKKYFEVLACKTLLLAPTFKELEDLGFLPDYHFVAIDSSNFKEKAHYYLFNKKERERIAENGYHFVNEEHSVGRRARGLLNMIESILLKEGRN
ncbi:glycosyltransferase [Metabacillus fastidiosus]|uniref:Glycosyltransferase n=1 Tax=Metabacillus fastidiosus TaxID=1458 RepID=A0ABU6P2E0_9BACI|nr:glycosyltransferase [Metabacillus fastidiosus]MED4403225.1 glycosyltransferase [Metabacillus fastidiosus]MED4455460.1 glycosyltransferase [Metabacillus fastidiosus]MED4461649.1 glycosyltransferase [Metabacillus fastidiosus]